LTRIKDHPEPGGLFATYLQGYALPYVKTERNRSHFVDGLTSYDSSLVEGFREVGIHVAGILKREKSTEFGSSTYEIRGH
jgi:hypothetical protein